MSGGSAASSLARATRAALLETLERLQERKEPPDCAERALEHLARAVSALYAAEAESPSESAADADLRLALVELSRTLEALHEVPSARREFEHETASVARALAQLYPELRRAERKQRERLLPGAEPSEDSPAAIAMGERLVAPPRSERARAAQLVEDAEQRRAVERTVVEVDVGLLSDSNFYTGLSEDVSSGGVFVATHTPLAVGTLVQLFFTLDGGQSIEVGGVVRWSRETGPSVTPGMGIAFSELSREQAAAIDRYATSRPPLFHL